MPQAQTQVQTQVQQTQPPASAPVRREKSFGTFSFGLTFFIILAIFCVVYFALRRKPGSTKHVDKRAGDEGED